MKAARFYNNHDIRIETVPKPSPKTNQLLLDIAWGGICGTDLHEYTVGPLVIPKKDRPHVLTGAHLPVTIGHEFCGHITQLPENAIGADGTPLRIGQAVMVDPRLNCGSCFSCKGGESHICGKWGFLGLHGGGGGGFSETAAVKPEMCYPLPDDLPLDHAVLIEPLAVGRHALTMSGVPPSCWLNTSVLVLGGGPVGFSVLCNLRAAGATQVYLSEPTAQRQAQTKPWSSEVFNPLEQDVPSECRKATGGKGVDIVFDCAGIAAGMKDGLSALRPRGTYVNVAGWEGQFVLPMHLFMVKECTLRSSMAYDEKDFGDVVSDFIAGMSFPRYSYPLRAHIFPCSIKRDD